MNTSMNKKNLLGLLIFFSLTSHAQLQLLSPGDLINEITDLQNGLIPVLSTDSKMSRFCLDDIDYCDSTGPIHIPFPAPPYEPLDPRIMVAIIDHQLVMLPKDMLSVSNGFSPVSHALNVSNGFAYFNNGDGSGFLKLNGYLPAKNMVTLLKHSIPVALEHMADQSLVFEAHSHDDESTHDDHNETRQYLRNEGVISRLFDLFEITDSVYVMLDGVMVEMNVGTLANGIRSGVFIVSHATIFNPDMVVEAPNRPPYTTTFGDGRNPADD